MTEIIRVFRDSVPALRFIGKKYPDFGPWWGEWFAGGWFDMIEQAMGGTGSILDIWENGAGYVGLERRAEGQPFEYWIGMFAPAGTQAPEGFSCVDFPASVLGTCWIYGPESEVHSGIPGCLKKVTEAGMTLWHDEAGGTWSFENGLCPRFTTPDEKGNVILDYCWFAE